MKTGKILHIDGDRKYSQKSNRYYKQIGLSAIVLNIPEYRQPILINNLLKMYNPDILVITGHDKIIAKTASYNDIYNYKNSRYFVKTVIEARNWEPSHNKLVIFAGACQSYFEALILAGANFASSPDRILIDYKEPLIVAKKVALTETYKYITIDEISKELKSGLKGIGGSKAPGKKSL